MINSMNVTDEIMAALESLDARLGDQPMQLGESREHPFVRVVIERPFMVTFRVNEKAQVVRVSSVSYLRSRGV